MLQTAGAGRKKNQAKEERIGEQVLSLGHSARTGVQVTTSAGQAPTHCSPWGHRILGGAVLLPQTNPRQKNSAAAEVLQSERFSHREAAKGDA